LSVSVHGARRIFAQLALEGDVPLTVAMPISGGTDWNECKLSVHVEDATVYAGVSFLDPRVDAVALYLNRGNLEDAARIAPDAEALLQQKMMDPFGAILGGYALLRLGEIERLHHWPQNLAKRFSWLPDGAIIAGEEAAREGDHETAIRFFCDAHKSGLPLFADGFSLLVSRVREYAQPAAPPGVSKQSLRDVQAVADAVLPLTPFMHFARISLAFHGASIEDPVHSQEPFEPGSEPGWHRYDAARQQLVKE
jgi:hypothetical protein